MPIVVESMVQVASAPEAEATYDSNYMDQYVGAV